MEESGITAVELTEANKQKQDRKFKGTSGGNLSLVSTSLRQTSNSQLLKLFIKFNL